MLHRPRRSSSRAVAAALVAASLLLAGCGGGDDEGSPDDAAPSEPVLGLVRAVVEGFLATYAEHPVTDLVTDLGLDAASIAARLTPLASRAVGAAREAGELEGLVRSRLAPFWDSPEVVALLGAGLSAG